MKIRELPPSRLSGTVAVLVVLALCGCAMLGAALSVGAYLPAFGVVAVLGAIFLFASTPLVSSYRMFGRGIFWTGFFLTFLTIFGDLFLPIKISGLMEVWLIALLPVLLIRWVLLCRLSICARWVLLLFVFYAFCAGLSGVLADSQLKSSVYQFAYNLKLPLMLALGVGVCWTISSERKFFVGACIVAVYILLWLLLDIGAPSFYRTLAGNLKELSVTSNPLLLGLARRYSGPFLHSSELAFFGVLFAIFFWIRLLSRLGSQWLNCALFCLFLAFVAASGQQQEAVSALIVFLTLLFLVRTKPGLVPLMVLGFAAFVSVILSAVFLGEAQLTKLGAEWGLFPGVAPIDSARPVFFRDAFALANQYFPLGTGLGTFGGVGAQLYDRDLYDALGYSRYWWYRKDLFLLDTYWPNFIAEGGWLGAIAMLGLVVLIVVYAFVHAWRANDLFIKRLWLMAFGAQFFAATVSITSPIYSDPNIVVLPFLFFGMAWTQEQFARIQAVVGSPSGRNL